MGSRKSGGVGGDRGRRRNKDRGGREGAWDGRMSNMYASAEGRGVLACIPRLPLFSGGGRFVGFWEKRGNRRKKKGE